MRIKVRLQEILDERGISQRQLALIANMRPGTINALCREQLTEFTLAPSKKFARH